MARAKRHHFVPQMHQRRFGAYKRGMIWVYDKETDETHLRPIKDTAVIGNYYTVPTAAGPDDGLEKIFAQVEGAAKPIIDLICEAEGPRFAIDREDRMALAAYLGLLHSRVPAQRLAAQQIAEHLGSITIDMELAHADGFVERARQRGWDGTDEEIEQERVQLLADFRSGKYRLRAPEEMTLRTVVGGFSTLPPYIASMGWVIIRRSTFPWFIVGDSPVTLWPSRDAPAWRGAGFATIDAEVSVPLDPSVVLVMGHNLPDGWVFDEKELHIPWNQLPYSYHYRTWARAVRFVFGRSEGDLQAIQYMMTPEERRRSYSGIGRPIGGPKEWQGYFRSTAAGDDT